MHSRVLLRRGQHDPNAMPRRRLWRLRRTGDERLLAPVRRGLVLRGELNGADAMPPRALLPTRQRRPRAVPRRALWRHDGPRDRRVFGRVQRRGRHDGAWPDVGRLRLHRLRRGLVLSEPHHRHALPAWQLLRVGLQLTDAVPRRNLRKHERPLGRRVHRALLARLLLPQRFDIADGRGLPCGILRRCIRPGV